MTRSLIGASALCAAGVVWLGSAGRPAMAHYCEDGQMPVAPAIAARMALPLCGFAATKRWGPNGCQLCDSRNMYPNPYSGPDRPRRGRSYRAYE